MTQFWLKYRQKSVLRVRVWEVRGKIFLKSLNWHIPLFLSSIPVGSTDIRLGVRQSSCDHEEHKDGKILGPFLHGIFGWLSSDFWPRSPSQSA